MAVVPLLGLLALCSPGQALSFAFGLGSPEVGVSFCCPEGEVLVVRGRGVECVVGESGKSFEGKEVWTGGEDGEKRALKKLEVKTPTCRRGLRLNTVRINGTENKDNITRNLPLLEDIELRGGNRPGQGNVYVTINSGMKPVCDDDWGDVDAGVACRMLGFAGGRATRESRFGTVPGGNFGMDDVLCQGNEESLFDCSFSSHDNCGPDEAAGVICEGEGQMANEAVLTVEGGLTFPRSEARNGTEQEEPEDTKALQPGTFCLAEGFTIEGSGRTDEREELTAVYCNSCLNQVTCTYAKELYRSTCYNKHASDKRDKTFFVADTDGNGMVDFEEFHSKLKEYLNVVFNALDSNKDGSIYDEAIGGNILKSFSLKTFESVVGEVMDFFDSNHDDTFSIDDSFIQQDRWYQHLRRKGQDVTFMDWLGFSFITLPAPLYNLYSHLDRNKDEALSRAEALDFIQRIFKVIDTNSDCHIDSDEVVALLTRFEVPWDQQLALKMLMEQYLSLASFMVKTFVEQADTNSLNKVTMEEVINFNDFEFIDKVIESDSLWLPGGALSHLSRRHISREESEAMVAMWLTALQGLMEEPALSGPSPPATCSTS